MALYHRFENPLFADLLRAPASATDVSVVLLARTPAQAVDLEREGFGDLVWRGEALDGRQLVAGADAVISAGGSMNREAAVLGTPAYSIYAGQAGAPWTGRWSPRAACTSIESPADVDRSDVREEGSGGGARAWTTRCCVQFVDVILEVADAVSAPDAVKLLHVAGARPNFMKVAPVMAAVEAWNARSGPRPHGVPVRFSQTLVHTGPALRRGHERRLLPRARPARARPLPRVGSGTHAEQTADVMRRLEPVLLEERPDLVLVVGDVNSTLAAALCAAKLQIPVAHVEAGLRSGDREHARGAQPPAHRPARRPAVHDFGRRRREPGPRRASSRAGSTSSATR